MHFAASRLIFCHHHIEYVPLSAYWACWIKDSTQCMHVALFGLDIGVVISVCTSRSVAIVLWAHHPRARMTLREDWIGDLSTA